MKPAELKARLKTAHLILKVQAGLLVAAIALYLILFAYYSFEIPHFHPQWINLAFMVILLGIDLWALRTIQTSYLRGMLVYAWAGWVCVVGMVLYFTWQGPREQIPTIIFTFHIGIFSISLVIGFRRALEYALASILVLIGLSFFYEERSSLVVAIFVAVALTFPSLLVDYLIAELRQSEEKLGGIFHESLDIILLLDPQDGQILTGNRALKWVLGYQELELVGRFLTELTLPGSQLVKEHRWQVESERRDAHGSEYFSRSDGTACPMDWTAARIPWGEGSAILLTLRDVTERELAEAERNRFTLQLRAAAELAGQINACLNSELLLKTVIDQLEFWFEVDKVLIYVTDESGEQLLPYSPDHEKISLSGSHILAQAARSGEILQIGAIPEVSNSGEAGMEPGMAARVVVPLMAHGRLLGIMDLQDRGADRFRPVDLDVFYTLAGQVAIALENARLFGELQKTAERLQALSHRLVEVQEQERRAIACELHDEIGQILTALKLLLDMSVGQSGKEQLHSLVEARVLARELLERVRDLSLGLRPPMLDDLGLLPALLWQFDRYTAQTHVRVSFRHSGLEQRFPTPVETAAYRIIQESLTNVARYAQVDEVVVRTWVDEVTLRVQVEDSGVGFDPQIVLSQPSSSGLSGMRERASLLGGQLAVESQPGAGTCLTAELPL